MEFLSKLPTCPHPIQINSVPGPPTMLCSLGLSRLLQQRRICNTPVESHQDLRTARTSLARALLLFKPAEEEEKGWKGQPTLSPTPASDPQPGATRDCKGLEACAGQPSKAGPCSAAFGCL